MLLELPRLFRVRVDGARETMAVLFHAVFPNCVFSLEPGKECSRPVNGVFFSFEALSPIVEAAPFVFEAVSSPRSFLAFLRVR